MYKTNGFTANLRGTPYEMGREQARVLKGFPALLGRLIGSNPIEGSRFKEMVRLFEEFCPGLNEELLGFADELEIKPDRVGYYYETVLEGGCSLAALLPGKSGDGHPRVLRNYDLSAEIADMRLCSTSPKGKLSHTGFSVSIFGRSEGLNEAGLCAAFASSGMPVGFHPGMKKPSAGGLQFMAIVRSLLENCKNTTEAKDFLKEMPIAANMNLLVADAAGNALVYETVDGRRALREAEADTGYLIATNHAIALDSGEGKLEQSLRRYQVLDNYFQDNQDITKEMLLNLLKKEYPSGPTVHNYRENFGTVHSILFDLHERIMDVSFGTPQLNSRMSVKAGEKLPEHIVDVSLLDNHYGPDFWTVS